MRRILIAGLFVLVSLVPVALGAQEIPASQTGPWWWQVLVFVLSLPYTLWMVFVQGEALMLLPAPLLAIGFTIWSFREWRRQRYWTPRIVHVLAVLGLLTIIAINVDWVMAGGEMWTQRYVVIALFGIFPYVAYLLLLGPRFLGRRRAPAAKQPATPGFDLTADLEDEDAIAERRRKARQAAEKREKRGSVLVGASVVFLLGVFGMAMAGGSSGPTSTPRPELAELRDLETVAPQVRAFSQGDDDAPITIIEFVDYQCPACGVFGRRFKPQVDSAFIETGAARFVHLDLPLTSRHDHAMDAARSAHCAADQDAFWSYQSALYEHQRDWSEMGAPSAAFETYARDLGLDADAFRECLASGRHTDAVQASSDLAKRFGINSTPTVIIILEGGETREVEGYTYRRIATTIEEMRSMAPH